MSLSLSSYTYNRKTWENSEFPVLCQTCLGDNPYLRMQKEKYGAACHVCDRPMTVFRWCPGRGMRYKKTEICQTCAKIKNVCQTCLLDLEYGLPVQVRDAALQVKDEVPKHGANRDYYIQNVEREIANTDGTTPGGELAKLTDTGSNEILRKLARTQPYYARNRPHICSFWVKGECKRGEECPYRHDKPTDPDDPLSDQNMKDRYYGSQDPVADKMMARVKAMPTLCPPNDSSITTLYVGNIGDEGYITEDDLRNYFYQYGELRSIHVVQAKGCAFVQYTNRDAAERAADRTFNKLLIKNRRLTIRWGRPQSTLTAAARAAGEGRPLDPVPGLPGDLPAAPDFFNLSGDNQSRKRAADDGQAASEPQAKNTPSIERLAPPLPPVPAGLVPPNAQARHKVHYPSMDPQFMGAKDMH